MATATLSRVTVGAVLLIACAGGDDGSGMQANGVLPPPGSGGAGASGGGGVQAAPLGGAGAGGAIGVGGRAGGGGMSAAGAGGMTAGAGGMAAGAGGMTAGAGGMTAGGGGMGGVPGASAEPTIPAVTGQCPTFASGNFSFGGLSGVMDVGPKGSGDGALLFYWHGTGGSASNYAGFFGGIGAGNIQKITSAGGIIVAVQGATGSGDATCSGTAVFDGDFTVIDQIVACAVRDHAINPRRIYATGCSAGGLQSGCMAARRAGYVAAVAPNSGGMTFPSQLMGAPPGFAPAAFCMHGGSGDNVGVNFGDTSATFEGIVTAAGGYAVDCNHMSGHCGAPADLYTAAIDFLLAHPYGVDPEPYAGGLPAGVPSYCEVQ